MNLDAMLDKATDALFSEDRVYRYALIRRWGEEPCAAFIGLNPSTADERKNDPTVSRCIGFAKRWGFGGLLMLNVFAFRSTDPKRLRSPFVEPIGKDNDLAIVWLAQLCPLVVAAWGVHGALGGRGETVRKKLVEAGIGDRLKVLGLTRDGHPKHPLYLSSKLKPVPWEVK